jgi:Domain of Unknown Function (DUF928)
MNYLTTTKSWKIFSLTLFWLLIGLTNNAVSIQVQANVNLSSATNKASKKKPQPLNPPGGGTGNGTPNGRIPTGTQGPCNDVPQNNGDNLIALVPPYDTDTLTTEAQPTFWFFIPHKAGEYHSMRFQMENAAGKTIYDTKPTVNNTRPGVIGVRLPQNQVSLEVNQKYRFRFTLYCQDPQSVAGRGSSFIVTARLTRVAINDEVKKKLATAKTPQDQADIYRENGIWLDVLTTLGNSRRSDGNNAALNTAWADLIKDFDFKFPDLGSKPIVDDVQPNTSSSSPNGRVRTGDH